MASTSTTTTQTKPTTPKADGEPWKTHILQLLFPPQHDEASQLHRTDLASWMRDASEGDDRNGGGSAQNEQNDKNDKKKNHQDLRLFAFPCGLDDGQLLSPVCLQADPTLKALPWKSEVQGFSWHPEWRHPQPKLTQDTDATEGRVIFIETDLLPEQVVERLQHAIAQQPQQQVSQVWDSLTLKDTSLFLPNLSLPCLVPFGNVHPRLAAVIQEIDRACTRAGLDVEAAVDAPSDDTTLHFWDAVLTTPETSIGGFGTTAAQLYVKAGFTCTMLHDELCWSSAVNYMLRGSVGTALWIAFNLNEVMPLMGHDKATLLEYMETSDVAIFVRQLWAWRTDLPSLTFAWQTPGTTVYSPSGHGSAHLVITAGHLIEQVAWNRAFSETGVRACLEFWQDFEPVPFNCGLATLYVVPCLALQYRSQLHFGCDTYLERLREIFGSQEAFSAAIARVTTDPRHPFPLPTTTASTTMPATPLSVRCIVCGELPTLLMSALGVCELCLLF